MKRNSSNQKSNNKGFTLIEIIIVIVLIGGLLGIFIPKMVAQFSTSNVNNGMNEIIDAMRSIDDASQQYNVALTKEVAIATGLADLVTGGYMKSTPIPPASYLDPAYTGAGYVYALDGTTYKGFANAANNDTVVKMTGVTQAVCQAIDVKFGIIAAGAAPPAAISYTNDLQCFGAGGATGYTVLKLVYGH